MSFNDSDDLFNGAFRYGLPNKKQQTMTEFIE
jgi:hypothetical protein